LAEIAGNHVLRREAVAGDLAEVVSNCIRCHSSWCVAYSEEGRTAASNVEQECTRNVSPKIENMFVGGSKFVYLDSVNTR
jgi:hypothetical protein